MGRWMRGEPVYWRQPGCLSGWHPRQKHLVAVTQEFDAAGDAEVELLGVKKGKGGATGNAETSCAPFTAAIRTEVGGKVVEIRPKPLCPEDKVRADADEILFTLQDRAGLAYAEYVSHVTHELVQGLTHLSDADKRAVIFTAVEGRESLWLAGSAYSRIRGAKYNLDTGDAGAGHATPVSEKSGSGGGRGMAYQARCCHGCAETVGWSLGHPCFCGGSER